MKPNIIPSPIRFKNRKDAQRFLGILKDGKPAKVLYPNHGKQYKNAPYELGWIMHPDATLINEK